MTATQFGECFHLSMNRYHCQKGKKPSTMRLDPDAQQGLREMVLSMSLIAQVGSLPKYFTENNGPLGNYCGLPLFPMKANGVAAV